MSSHGRTRVISIMLEAGELNISEITKRAGLSHTATARHLEFLEREGLVTEKRFNRIRIFRIDAANPMTAALLRFYAEWKDATALVA